MTIQAPQLAGCQAIKRSPKAVHSLQQSLQGHINTLVLSYASHATRLGGSQEDHRSPLLEHPPEPTRDRVLSSHVDCSDTTP